MTLPVKQEDGAEQVLGTTSLEIVRGRVLCNVYDNPDLSWAQQKRIIKELDCLIENEKCRREELAIRQWQKEELEHGLVIAQKQAEIYQKYADIVRNLRLHKAETNQAVARCERDSLMYKVDVIERLMQIKAKYKPVEKQDDHLKELSKIKKKQKLSEAREQAILDSIAKKAMSRASFIKMINDKFPDMVDELIDFYDQQIYRQGIRR
ncbi:MAG: hypothetical protein KAR42_02990 [candidate division Zixibacteria bacterium]|nr:hypothetical protein [candidate division Zixibacteria bacterium]